MNWLMAILGIGATIYSIYNLKILKRDEIYGRNKLFYISYAALGVCSAVAGATLFSGQTNKYLIWAMLVLHIIALFLVPKKK